ncbi:hypothetical protein [Luteimonas terricola]|uniref:DUF998 domain-containing protein n=1 Tax=Luteimonas terricola TaxID=645597 RepID=A0ABQ2EB70_9GAMM|nr:hypothetical protein [Luteimonas terricola]GGK04712.1 hypothetical protein GCM10011394_12270 [Luteimonas terricola]
MLDQQLADPQRATFPVWPLPLAIAALLVVAVHLAWGLSVRDGHVPACIPYLEGCTSISRAARHGLGNHVFRLMVLPCTALLALHWWSSARWLALRGALRGGGWLLALGVAAAVALAVYATFLGTEGAAYRFMRRYGVIAYFGASYLAQLLFLRMGRAVDAPGGRLQTAMVAICGLMLALGVGNVAASALVADPLLKDRIENVLEWQLGVFLVAWYLLQAWLWHRSGYRLGLVLGPGGPPRAS